MVKILEFINANQTVSGWAFTLVFSLVAWFAIPTISERIAAKRVFLEQKPLIGISLHWILDGPELNMGRIVFVEISNFGKNTAQNVCVEFFHRKCKYPVDGKRKMKYLPPSLPTKYHRPYTIASFNPECFPEIAKVSYDFMGERHYEKIVLIEEKREDRGDDLELYKQES